MAVGRPSEYSQDIADAICLGLSEGRSLRSICQADNQYDLRKTSGVYLIQVDDCDVYVGQSVNVLRRVSQHMQPYNLSGARKIQKALSSATIVTAFLVEETQDLDVVEQSWIDMLSVAGVSLLNTEMQVGSFSSGKHVAPIVMPWGRKQAPFQKAIIALRRIARDLKSTEADCQADILQRISSRLKKDPEKWIAVNTKLAERMPALCGVV